MLLTDAYRRYIPEGGGHRSNTQGATRGPTSLTVYSWEPVVERHLPSHLLTLPIWSMLPTDAYRRYIPKGEGEGAILKKLQGDPLPLLCATLRNTGRQVVERHHRAENVLLPNHLLTLLISSMLLTDAYRRYIPEGEGTGAILKELQGDPLPLLCTAGSR
jgi:hypothetical protein